MFVYCVIFLTAQLQLLQTFKCFILIRTSQNQKRILPQEHEARKVKNFVLF